MGEMADYDLDYAAEWDDEEFNPYPIKLDRGPGLCPKCKSETILKNGKFGSFYGCSKFPKCDGSRAFDGE